MKNPLALLSLFLVLGGAIAYADIPYTDPAGQGTQAWCCNLALTFDVNSPIQVNMLGVFNYFGTDTLTTPITVGIYDNTNSAGTLVTSVTFQAGVSYAIGGAGFDLFQFITPVVLGPGSYEIDAVGFGSGQPAQLNGNLNTGSSTGPILNNLGGKITFTGAAWDSNSVLDDPLTCDICQPAPAQYSQFDAGTFATPEPGFYEIFGGFGVVSVGLLFLSRRRRAAKNVSV